MNNIIQKIDKVFDENKLIGNYDFTEDEYSLMVDYVSDLCIQLILNHNHTFDKGYHELIFATLVAIAKRWKDIETGDEQEEEDNSFWCFIFKTLVGEDEYNQKLYHAFTNLISQMGSQNKVVTVKTGQKYYATLMMHSFAPKNSLYSFFDLCYNIFKKDLDFGFTVDDEWICYIIAIQIEKVLEYDYREDKKVSIGSSAYSIKIGLRSFANNEDLYLDFVKFIKETLSQINKLFNREKVREDTRIKRHIVEWWRNKIELENLSEKITSKKRVSTVLKQNIIAKYIRSDNEVFLCIPSIRLDDSKNTLRLLVFVENELVSIEEMRTKQGELVYTTKSRELELNELLTHHESINVRVKILEDEAVIFDSEKNKTSSLVREFILFDGEKEVFSQINRPTNYFIFSKDIDALKNIPSELTTYSTNLYNIYPNAGESLIGETKRIFFIKKDKACKLGEDAFLIGNLNDVEWLLDDISCLVYNSSAKLMIPENLNLKALELRIDNKPYKLNSLNYEQLENNCYQYEIKSPELIIKNEPIEIALYSYEREAILFTENIIYLPNLDIQFNESLYYGDIDKKVTITTENNRKELAWTNHDNEIKWTLYEGVLLIKIPYFRWRINNRDWYNEPIDKKLWYRDFLKNGDLLDINNPKEDKDIKVFGKVNGKQFEISRNQSGKYEIGRFVYANEGLTDISIYTSISGEYIFLFNVATKEHFINSPLSYRNGIVFWDIEYSFVGDRKNDFFLNLKGDGNNVIEIEIGEKNRKINKLAEGIYKVEVSKKEKNIFLGAEDCRLIYEGELVVGRSEKFKFKNKKIVLKKAYCAQHDCSRNKWFSFIPKYYIDKLQFVQEQENIYYSGRLCVLDKNDKTIILNSMENEIKSYDKINPVRVELRDNSTLWLAAGWQGGLTYLGNLFCDIRRRGICNIEREDNLFSEISLYKFEEVEDV